MLLDQILRPNQFFFNIEIVSVITSELWKEMTSNVASRHPFLHHVTSAKAVRWFYKDEKNKEWKSFICKDGRCIFPPVDPIV